MPPLRACIKKLYLGLGAMRIFLVNLLLISGLVYFELNNHEMDKLKALLRKECAYVPSDDLLDRFLSLGELHRYDSGSILTETGVTDTNMYVVKKGIVRFSDFDGDRERTFAFALPGTVFYNKYSFVKNLESYYQVDLWGDCEIIAISRSEWRKLVAECHDAALWMLSYAQEELFFQEYKNARIYNGSAAERFKSLLCLRPELLKYVPQKILASYLGITPEYFSRLKRRFKDMQEL